MTCPNCDREDCDVEAAREAFKARGKWLTRDELIEFRDARDRLAKATTDCAARFVNWCARARAAEARVLTADEVAVIKLSAAAMETNDRAYCEDRELEYPGPQSNDLCTKLRAIIARLEAK